MELKSSLENSILVYKKKITSLNNENNTGDRTENMNYTKENFTGNWKTRLLPKMKRSLLTQRILLVSGPKWGTKKKTMTKEKEVHRRWSASRKQGK